MTRTPNRDDVRSLKGLLATAWRNVSSEARADQIYAAGFYTNEFGEFMFPFLMSEAGLARVVGKYVEKGIYTADVAAENLRWSAADSPHNSELSKTTHLFEGRPDLNELAPPAAKREARYRLTAARDALRELDAEGLFGTGPARQNVTLYLEGGDVTREWTLDWATQVNPKAVYERFASIGAEVDRAGTFSEFGTKKVYETKAYAQSGDLRLLAAATQSQLFLFDTHGPKQLFARALPTKEDYCSIGGVAMSASGEVIAVIPFGGGRHERLLFIVTGMKADSVRTVELPARPMAVAVSPMGEWIIVTDEHGALHRLSPEGVLLGSHAGHAGWPRGIAVSPDGDRVVTADSSTLVIWDADDWSKRHTLPITADLVDFDSTGQRIVCACRYAPRGTAAPKTARILHADSGGDIQEITAEGYRIQVARFSPDGETLACAAREDTDGYAGTKTALLIDVATGVIRNRLLADFEQIRDFAFLPDRNEIAVAVFGHTRRPLVLWKQS